MEYLAVAIQVFGVLASFSGLYWKIESVRRELDGKISTLNETLTEHRIHGNGKE